MNNASIAAVILTCTLGMLVAVSGEAPPDARVDITRGRLPDSPATEVRACVKALGGQNLKVAWHFGPAADKDGKPVTVHIHRVTGARRVPLAEMKLEAPAGEVNWAWDVPVVKGPARYEATLDLPVPVVLVIEATDRASHEAALKALANAKLTSTGAKDAEVAALRQLGLKPTAGRAATGSNEVVILIESNGENGGGGWRREVRFSGDAPGEVVWAAGPGPNDWRARMPRAWISPAVLETTEGRIRLVECLFNPPRLP